MTRQIIQIMTLLTVLLGSISVARAADVNAWLDRTRIAEGETVQLTLEAHGQVSGQPDTTPLEQDFEVLGLSTGSRVNIINGRTDARTTWTLSLSPKHGGTLTIPALRVGGSRSKALQLEVSAAPVTAPGDNADILIETELSDKQPYVQGQVLYSVRLLYTKPFKSGQLSEPKPENSLVRKLGDDREFATTRNGWRYQVIERRYALFPQASGALELDAPVFDGEVPDTSRRRASPFKRFFGNDPFFGQDPFEDLMTPTRRVRVRGKPAELDVRPRPAAAQGAHWLPAQQLVLNGTWQPDAAEVKAGEPVTLVLDMEARGLTGGQLPDPAPATVKGFDVYPDQAQRRTDTDDSGVTGHLQQKIAFIPQRGGTLTLPAIELHWWDTATDRERVATLPERVVQVQPGTSRLQQAPVAPVAAAGGAMSAQPVPPGSNPAISMADVPLPAPSPAREWASGPWFLVSVVLAGGWLLTLLTWWWRTRGVRSTGIQPSPDTRPQAARSARKQFLAACKTADSVGARRALLDWAALHWPDDPPRGLDKLALRIDNAEVHAALAELDRAIYKEGSTWDGTQLARCLQQLPDPDTDAGKNQTALAPLYPDSKQHSYG